MLIFVAGRVILKFCPWCWWDDYCVVTGLKAQLRGRGGMKIGNTSKRLFTVGGLVTKVELKLTSGSLNWQKYQSILFLWRKWYCRNVSPAYGICNHMYQGNLGPISQRYSGYKFPPTHPKYWIDNPGINFILTFNWRRLKSSYINTFYLS